MINVIVFICVILDKVFKIKEGMLMIIYSYISD